MKPVLGMESFSKLKDSLEWMKFPGYESEEYPSFAFVWGNPMQGPSGFFMKLSAGYETRLHKHSSDYHAVIVQGALKIWKQGQTLNDVQTLKPGSYHFQRGGEAHIEAVVSDVDCIAYLHQMGPTDYMEIEDATPSREKPLT